MTNNYFIKKINELIIDSKKGSQSPEELAQRYEDIKKSLDFNIKAGLIDKDSADKFNNTLDQYKRILDSKLNIVDVDQEAKRSKKSKLKKGLAIGAATLAGAGALAAGLSACNKKTNENENVELNSLDAVKNQLSNFINECLNNGIDLNTDEALMLMYASNIETAIDVGDNMTLEQVVVNHYIDLAEDLIANNPDYAGRLVSEVASELMTNDYQSSLAKINDAFIKYGYIAPTSKLIANTNDSKTLSDFEAALRVGIDKKGDFSKANKLVEDIYKENSKVLRGTRIIVAGQYSAINAYGQNAGVKITGMDQAAFDAIFAKCGGGNVNDISYTAYTTYMTEVRSYLHVYTDQQIIAWEALVAAKDNMKDLAQNKYNQINDYVVKNRVSLVTPENVNKPRLDNIDKENAQASQSLNDRLNNGGTLKTDSNGNQYIVQGSISESEKAAIEKADQEKAEQDATIDYENGYHQDSNGNVVDSDGNKVNPPVDGAPTMTEDEIKDMEDAANDLLKDPVISEEFTPIDPVVVEETETVIEKDSNGSVISQTSSSSTQSQIDELEKMKDEINNAVNNGTPDFNPFEPEVTYDLAEGWNPDGTLKDGYTFDDNGNVVKVGKVK